MIIDKLKKLGFTPTVAGVYYNLVLKGKSKAGELITDTRLHRSAVYAALSQLVERDLISVTRLRGVKYYRANDPNHLVVEADQNKKIAASVVEDLKLRQEVPAREVAIYEGIEGIKHASDKCLQAPAGETIYFLGPSKFGPQGDLEGYWTKFHKTRNKRGLYSKILYDQATDQSIVDWRNNLPQSEAKYLPFGAQMPIWFIICGDTLTIIVPGEEPLLTFNIKSRSAANGMKKYFDYFWNQESKKV